VPQTKIHATNIYQTTHRKEEITDESNLLKLSYLTNESGQVRPVSRAVAADNKAAVLHETLPRGRQSPAARQSSPLARSPLLLSAVRQPSALNHHTTDTVVLVPTI